MASCLSACGAVAASPCGPERATVTRVIDGDTVVLDGGDKVRYLLVDANELEGGACYGREALEENRRLVEGQTVDLGYDVECSDRYGRLLAYVSVAGRDVGRLLVERGYACVLYIPPDGAGRRAELEAAEAAARDAHAGMWGACPEVACAE